MDVEVDLYSGRGNPRFRLSPAAGTELLRRIAGLDPVAGAAALRDVLGYRGLRITPGAAGAPIVEIAISGGVVLAREHSGRELWLRDPGREVERWLVAQAGLSLEPGVVELLLRDLG